VNTVPDRTVQVYLKIFPLHILTSRHEMFQNPALLLPNLLTSD